MATKRISYEWKAGTRLSKDANIVGETVEKIRRRDGVCPPEALVDAARPVRSPLHDGLGFIWDDHAAAEVQRRDHARWVLNHCVEVEVKSGEVRRTPAFVSVVETRGGQIKRGYVPFHVAQRNSKMSTQIVYQALDELRRARMKWEAVTDELSAAWEVVRGLEGEYLEDREQASA